MDDLEKRAEEYAASGGRWADGNMNGDDDPRAGYVRGCRAGYIAGARAERERYETMHTHNGELIAENHSLRAENAKLRAALADVWHLGLCAGELKDRVQAALRG